MGSLVAARDVGIRGARCGPGTATALRRKRWCCFRRASGPLLMGQRKFSTTPFQRLGRTYIRAISRLDNSQYQPWEEEEIQQSKLCVQCRVNNPEPLFPTEDERHDGGTVGDVGLVKWSLQNSSPTGRSESGGSKFGFRWCARCVQCEPESDSCVGEEEWGAFRAEKFGGSTRRGRSLSNQVVSTGQRLIQQRNNQPRRLATDKVHGNVPVT
jgi:hypothetical protein